MIIAFEACSNFCFTDGHVDVESPEDTWLHRHPLVLIQDSLIPRRKCEATDRLLLVCSLFGTRGASLLRLVLGKWISRMIGTDTITAWS